MSDLVRDLRDHHVVVQEGGAWRLSRSLEEVEQDLPASTRGMIERKIARMGADDQRLLKAASVQGFEFDSNVLATVLSQEMVDVEDHLERLDRVHGFVRAIGEQTLLDGRTIQRFRFVHVLYQNVLYASLSAARRARWSLATARALIDQGDDQPGTTASHVAHLFETAHDPSRAAEYHLIASRRSAGMFAYHETITQVRRALGLLKQLPDTTTRDRQELEFLTLLGPALIAVKGYAVVEVQDVYTRAAALCERVGDERQQFTVLLNRWSIHELRGDMVRAEELGSQALHHATKTADSGRLLMAHDLAGETAFYRGAFDTARAHLERSIALYRAEAHHPLAVLHGGYDFGVAALCVLAHDLWYLGQPDRALDTNRRAIALSFELSHNHSMAWALVHGAFLHYLRRETDAARERAEAALKLCDEHDLVFWVAFARCLLGRAIAEQQDVERGLRDMHEGIAAYRATGSEIEVPFLLSLRAEICLKVGRLDEGLQAVVEALGIAEAKGIDFALAELYRQRGELLLASEPVVSFDAAEACFRQAFETGLRQGARSHRLRAACSVARLWQQRGEPDRARGALAESLHSFTEGFETQDLQDARLLLAGMVSSAGDSTARSDQG
jgi:predicted ATPase